jgi:hypothetical protein
MEVKAIGEMYGLFSTCSFSQGELVLKIEGEIVSQPSRTTIQIGPSQHVDVASPGKFINHSCNPNCKVENKQLIAIKNIAKGEEITFNYEESEDILAHPFICKDCGKWVGGKKFWKPSATSTVELLS